MTKTSGASAAKERLPDQHRSDDDERPRPEVLQLPEQIPDRGLLSEHAEKGDHDKDQSGRQWRRAARPVPRDAVEAGHQQKPRAEAEDDRRPAGKEPLERRPKEKTRSEPEQDAPRQHRTAKSAQRREGEKD